MGLDMYLKGEKFLPTDWSDDSNNLREDGFRVESINLELGYWRKHPDLHGYIVQEFADGVDECQPIHLGEEDLEKIIKAVKGADLPETSGFFFGSSGDAGDQNTIEQLEKAIAWLNLEETVHKESWKSVIYQASW